MDNNNLCDIKINYLKAKAEYYTQQITIFWRIVLLILLGSAFVFFFLRTIVTFAKLLLYIFALFIIVYLIISVLVMHSYSMKMQKNNEKLAVIYNDHIMSARMQR